jgi:hypothetical protein
VAKKSNKIFGDLTASGYRGFCSTASVSARCGSDLCSVGRTIRAKNVSMSDKLSGQNECGLSGAVAAVVPEPAGGTFSVGADSAAAVDLSNGIAGLAAVVVSLAVVSLSLGAPSLVLGAGCPSKLPRMTGKPSLALPMITTLELVDCAGCQFKKASWHGRCSGSKHASGGRRMSGLYPRRGGARTSRQYEHRGHYRRNKNAAGNRHKAVPTSGPEGQVPAQ